MKKVVVLKHAGEETSHPRLFDTLENLRNAGWGVFLLQDNRYDPFTGYDFDRVITDANPEKSFADFHNAVFRYVEKYDWLLYLDFDEFLCDDFVEKVAPYIQRDVHLYEIARVNSITPPEKTEEICRLYGWRYARMNIPECGNVLAINFPDYQTRLLRAHTGRWYGNVHERFVPDNAFKRKILPFDGGYIVHIKSYEKQINDNRLWDLYMKRA